MGQQLSLTVDEDGNAINFGVSQQSFSAFGEQLVAQLNPAVNIYFPYNLNSGILEIDTNSTATAVQESGMAKLSTGATSGSSAIIHSSKAVRYTPGQGINVRFTALYTSGLGVESRQYAGIGTENDGFFVGVSGTTFGIWHRSFDTQDFIPQTEFNGTLPAGTDWTLGNVYEIQYQWLGFGDIKFSVEHPDDGDFHLLHLIKYANANSRPSVSNPSMHLWLEVNNQEGTDDIILRSSSMGGFLEGPHQGQVLHFAASGSAILGSEGCFNVLTIKNNNIFIGQQNKGQIRPQFLSVSNDGNKDALIRLAADTTITSPVFEDIDSTRSFTSVDIVGTSPVVPSGNFRSMFVVSKNSSINIDLEEFELFIHPDKTFSVLADRVGGVTNITASLLWTEEY